MTHVKDKADEIIALLRSHAHRVLWGQGQGDPATTYTIANGLMEIAPTPTTPSGSPSKAASSSSAASSSLRDAANLGSYPSAYLDPSPSLSATPFAVLHRHAVVLSELDCPYQNITPSTHASRCNNIIRILSPHPSTIPNTPPYPFPSSPLQQLWVD